MTIARYLCLSLVVGCATPATALREDNQRLEQTVSDLRTDRRVQERKLHDLQYQLDELRGKTSSDGVPALPVEVAAPPGGAAAPMMGSTVAPATDAARVVGVTEDGTEIVYEGDAAAGRQATVADLDSDAQPVQPARRGQPVPAAPPMPARTAMADVPSTPDRLEVTRRVPLISARAATRSKLRDREPPPDRSDRSGDASGEYRTAVELVKAGKHDEAIAALRAFITKYPRHDYADNAQYWIGEAYYAQKDYTRALGEFRTVVEVYPRGNKVPDALLKVGYCYAALGQGEKARAMMEQVVTLYPKSEPAQLAAKRLETP